MPSITFRDSLHDVIHCQVSSHLSTTMPADAIGKHREKHRHLIVIIQLERSDSVTVFIVLARHARMRKGFNIQMGTHSADHVQTCFFAMTFGSDSAGGRFRSKRYINWPKWIRSPCASRRPSRMTGS